MLSLDLSESECATLAGHLVTDREGKEVLVGLDRDESEQYVMLGRSLNRIDPDAKRLSYLQERHQRAMLFWNIAATASGSQSQAMSAADAFDRGYSAWEGFAGVQQFDDFRAMIESIPAEHHLAALNGWLAAFDDEAERCK